MSRAAARALPAALLALFAVSCGGSGRPTPEPQPTPLTRAHAPRIDDEATWRELASRPRNHHVARTEVVKFVIALEGDAPTVYFVQSRRYESHYDFVSANLSDAFSDGMDFYRRVYRTEDRPYIVGSLLRYVDADAWTFELISGDNLAPAGRRGRRALRRPPLPAPRAGRRLRDAPRGARPRRARRPGPARRARHR